MNRSIKVQELLSKDAADLQLRVIAGETGLEKLVNSARIQKPGLALTGFTEFMHHDRVQILGSTELGFLERMAPQKREESCRTFCASGIAVLISTKGMKIPDALIDQCAQSGTALLTTPQLTSVFISRVENWLEDKLAPNTVMHGVLIESYGVGVLMLGKSGIGKSECALELIERGHRLVADDIVRIKKKGAETVYGTGDNMFQHHTEIRGLGILNIKDLFGISAVRDRKRIDLVVELVAWSEHEEYDRLGLEERRFPILDVELPLLTVPVRPGRNMGTIVEIAARNHVLKSMGVNTANQIQETLSKELAPGRRNHTDDVE